MTGTGSSQAELIARARDRITRSERRIAMSEALMRGSQRLLRSAGAPRQDEPAVVQAAEDEQDAVRALREIGLSLRAGAREICIEAQEARWLTQQTRERARQQRARAANLHRNRGKHSD